MKLTGGSVFPRYTRFHNTASPSSPESSIAQHVMDNRRHCLAHLLHKSPRVPQQLRNLAPTRVERDPRTVRVGVHNVPLPSETR
jgi:hypothetical protein